jgi:hypothetical protein
MSGSIGRGLLDPIVVVAEEHVGRLLREYVDYDDDERVPTSIGDAPNYRAVESQPSERAKVIGYPRVGGLHHRYRRREAARSAQFWTSISSRTSQMNIENRQGVSSADGR